jgi:hypothetical protein
VRCGKGGLECEGEVTKAMVEGKGEALYKGPYSGLVGTLEWTTEKKRKILPKLRKKKSFPRFQREKKVKK